MVGAMIRARQKESCNRLVAPVDGAVQGLSCQNRFFGTGDRQRSISSSSAARWKSRISLRSPGLGLLCFARSRNATGYING